MKKDIRLRDVILNVILNIFIIIIMIKIAELMTGKEIGIVSYLIIDYICGKIYEKMFFSDVDLEELEW